jgi:hypothetical protein
MGTKVLIYFAEIKRLRCFSNASPPQGFQGRTVTCVDLFQSRRPSTWSHRRGKARKQLPLSSPPLFSLSLLCLACGRGGGSGEDLVEIGKCARAGILVLKHGGAAVKDVDAALLKALAELGRNPHFPAGRAGGVASRG